MNRQGASGRRWRESSRLPATPRSQSVFEKDLGLDVATKMYKIHRAVLVEHFSEVIHSWSVQHYMDHHTAGGGQFDTVPRLRPMQGNTAQPLKKLLETKRT